MRIVKISCDKCGDDYSAQHVTMEFNRGIHVDQSYDGDLCNSCRGKLLSLIEHACACYQLSR